MWANCFQSTFEMRGRPILGSWSLRWVLSAVCQSNLAVVWMLRQTYRWYIFLADCSLDLHCTKYNFELKCVFSQFKVDSSSVKSNFIKLSLFHDKLQTVLPSVVGTAKPCFSLQNVTGNRTIIIKHSIPKHFNIFCYNIWNFSIFCEVVSIFISRIVLLCRIAPRSPAHP